ncbi:hypothetical protein EDD11_003334 [Mortierella claussenii]|nr:hypothetical protein EDD11_003334 [Mortierella claussenii]
MDMGMGMGNSIAINRFCRSTASNPEMSFVYLESEHWGYLTLDHKVVEIDKDYVREISGFSHPRSVQILSEETVYNGSSKKPTRVLLLERPLVGDGVALTRTFDGPMVPNLRQFTSDMAFLESFPELSRALRDFNNLCQEFENTYVYIRGFAAYTLEKLRLVYEKAYRDCVGDSVKLQKMLDRGIQVEQECFAELVENVVLGKLYQKLFIHSLVPCYAQRDVEIDEIIVKYHRHLFIAGVHRGIDGGACLAATVDSVLLEETLQKLGLTEKWRSMRIDLALEGAAGLFRAWDQEDEEQQQHGLNSHGSSQRSAMVHQFQESEQERRRRQLRESLRIFVQDDKYRSSADKKRVGSVAPDDLTRMQDQEEEEDEDEEEEDDPTASALWNTPLEKAYCIKLVLDKIATVAEEHLMSGQGFGFVHKKRSEVSVTTDDFIPLLAIVIIHAQMMRLGSNLFYVQRFRINTPKSDLNFALVTFEASVEFLKTDPLGLLGSDHTPLPSTPNLGSVSRTPLQGSHPRIEIEHKTPSEELQILPWGTPSHTGWGFSPPNASEVHAYDQSTPGSEKNSHAATSSAETSPARPPLSSRFSGSGDSQQQYQQRHSRAASVNFDDRLRRVAASRSEEGGGGGSSNNSSWSRSPMMGPRFTSGTNSPLGATSPTYGVLPSTSEAGPGPVGRRPSHQLVQMSQRHSISSGQSHMSSQLHRISGEHSRSTLLPLQSPSMTPQLVVKPQIMLPPPKTPPMSGQITSTPGRGRPMSMAVVGALASSAYSSSYSGSGMTSNTTTRKSFSSNHSSPATSPRLGPGNMSGSRSGSRSNSLMSGPFPLLRTNSANTVLTASELSQSGRGHSSSPHQQQQPSPPKKAVDPADPMSPMSPISPWASRNVIQPPPPRPQSPSMMALSVSPSQIHGSPATEEPSMSLALPATSETLIAKSSPRTRSPTSSSLSIHATPANPPPGRIRTSPSSTISSISTPTTPSTFSSASGHALLDSLNASVQLVSSGGKSGGSLVSSSSASSDAESMIATSTAPSSNSGSMRSPSSGLSRHNSMRLSLPRLSIAPSAPSTAFCKTTVTAAATHATTSVDELEPTSTAVMATTMTDEADSYGAGLAAIAMIIPPTPTTPSTEPIVHGSSRTSGSGRNSFSEDMRSSSTAFGMGFGKRAQEKSASAHQKLDSGKYVGSTTQHSATSSTASSNTTDDSSSNVKGHHRHHGRHHHHGTSYSTNNISCSNAIIEHFSHGTALDFEPGFLVKDELCVDSNLTMPDRRRGSATSLRHGGGGCGSFQPEKEIVLWNQAPSMAGGTIVNGHGRAAAGGRLTVSSGDLPTSESTIPGSFVGADSAIMTGSGSFFSRSYTLTPMSTPGPLSLNTNSLMEENGGPLQRTRQKQQMMMGDFLSELAKVEDGDVLVGNGRDGVMSRQ